MSKPKTDKIDHVNVMINGLEIGHSSMQGYRVSMEDAFIIESIGGCKGVPHTLVAILDGHAGDGCSAIASSMFCDVLERQAEWVDYCSTGPIHREDSEATASAKLDKIKKSLVHAFLEMDEELVTHRHMDSSGSALVCALITPTHIICANVGDSRCVIGSAGVGT
jgi:serine/threonine protein phosphatase PrpC